MQLVPPSLLPYLSLSKPRTISLAANEQVISHGKALVRKWDFPKNEKLVCIARMGDPLVCCKPIVQAWLSLKMGKLGSLDASKRLT